MIVLQLDVCVLQSDTHFYTQPIEPECHSSTATHTLFQIRATITTDISRREGWTGGVDEHLFFFSLLLLHYRLPPFPFPLPHHHSPSFDDPLCLHVCVCVLGLRRKCWMFRDSCVLWCCRTNTIFSSSLSIYRVLAVCPHPQEIKVSFHHFCFICKSQCNFNGLCHCNLCFWRDAEKTY